MNACLMCDYMDMINGCMIEWINVCKSGYVYAWMNVFKMVECVYGWVNVSMDGLRNGWTCSWNERLVWNAGQRQDCLEGV